MSKKVTKHRFRKFVIEAWGGHCAYCNCKPDRITLDHVVAEVNGGRLVQENLVPACGPCNLSKNHKDWREWFRAQGFHDSARERRIELWLKGPGIGR